MSKMRVAKMYTLIYAEAENTCWLPPVASVFSPPSSVEAGVKIKETQV